MDLAPDFSEFCGLLLAHRVEFVVVGAHALAFHGAPRFTGGLDIFVRPTASNGERVLSAIQAFGFPAEAVTSADVASGGKVIQLGVAAVQINAMSAIDGVSWAEVRDTRESGALGPHEVPFIGREAFLRNKRAAGRPKDLADVDALREPEP